MRKALVLLILVYGGLACGVYAQEESPSAVIENISESRYLGLGVEGSSGMYWGGGISGRYWFSPELGVEGIVYFESWEFRNGQNFNLEAAFKGLFRIVDAPLADFYTSAGFDLTLNQDELSYVDLLLSVGMEWGSVYIPSIAWNIEFGIDKTFGGGLATVFGAGAHYYFPQRQASTPNE
jgi:hypothetical protein